jgi:hypothetical protein
MHNRLLYRSIWKEKCSWRLVTTYQLHGNARKHQSVIILYIKIYYIILINISVEDWGSSEIFVFQLRCLEKGKLHVPENNLLDTQDAMLRHGQRHAFQLRRYMLRLNPGSRANFCYWISYIHKIVQKTLQILSHQFY